MDVDGDGDCDGDPDWRVVTDADFARERDGELVRHSVAEPESDAIVADTVGVDPAGALILDVGRCVPGIDANGVADTIDGDPDGDARPVATVRDGVVDCEALLARLPMADGEAFMEDVRDLSGLADGEAEGDDAPLPFAVELARGVGELRPNTADSVTGFAGPYTLSPVCNATSVHTPAENDVTTPVLNWPAVLPSV